MAQQLAATRTPAAYAGVTAYARSHSGEATSAAYLALGYAYLQDRRYPEAIASLQKSKAAGEALADYADFLSAQAAMQSSRLPEAETILDPFAANYPQSIFLRRLPVVQANLSLMQGDPQAALRLLRAHLDEPAANHADFQLALAGAYQMAGDSAEAVRIYRNLYVGYPLSDEAQQAASQLAAIGGPAPLSVQERRAHADALYAAGRYAEAGGEYRALAAAATAASESFRDSLLVAAAACDLKEKRLTGQELDRLPDTQDEAGARRLYLAVELARNKDDEETQSSLVREMEDRFAGSPWLAEALYSSGNMYLLKQDLPHAIEYYGDLVKFFPRDRYAPGSHWKMAWLNYRLGEYSQAAALFTEQIERYPGGREIPAALYWRGRVYEDQEGQPSMAAAFYRSVSDVFEHYYYAQLARERLGALGGVAPAQVAALGGIRREKFPELTDDVPEDDEHVVKAKLLANAGLNDYILPEIEAAEGSEEWGAFAAAEIYASYGETFRAMRVLKRAIPYYASAPIDALPMGCWKILFPQPYWDTIQQESAKNGIDPYMVASLIRQESEFNPGAVSSADALGLMQLLPSVGRTMAREEGIRRFSASALFNPDTNIRLGTRYLKQVLEKFGGQPAFAFAAYNAGDDRVTDWTSSASFHGTDEFVESIPFTETREYVQAILRNEAIYRELNQRAESAHPAGVEAQRRMGPLEPR